MILGIGIDSVEIERFAHWHTYSPKQLKRLFSQEEIDYSLSNPIKTAERFAARFAAKEAFYKALCATCTYQPSFFSIARKVEVIHLQSRPVLKVNSSLNQFTDQLQPKSLNKLQSNHMLQGTNQINTDKNQPIAHLSITHTKTTATAFVILEENYKKNI